MSIESDTRRSRNDLAETLRKLRKAAGLSGVLDVDRILTALEVPAEIATELLALARRANVEHTSWRSVSKKRSTLLRSRPKGRGC